MPILEDESKYKYDLAPSYSDCVSEDLLRGLFPMMFEEDTISDESGALRVLSLFSGCGGMDLGFEGNFIACKKSFPKNDSRIEKEINEEWVLASPEEEIDEGKKKINFISQGAFGTGLHETTQDLLRIILEKDFTNKRVLDIGTGSGILSLATAIKNASEVVAVDIRDVQDEIELNASLNNISTIKTLIGDAISGEITIEGDFDWIYINIGGEETEMFMPLINEHLKKDGKLLVSGLVEWSFEKVKDMVESYGFKAIEKHQTNEWCTAIFVRA